MASGRCDGNTYRPRSEPEQPDRVLFENERPHFVFDRDLFEIGQPAVGGKVFGRLAREIDAHLRLVQGPGVGHMAIKCSHLSVDIKVKTLFILFS